MNLRIYEMGQKEISHTWIIINDEFILGNYNEL